MHVDDANEADLVVGVRQEPQVREDVLDLLAVVEAHASDELVGNAVTQARLFQGPGLCVHPVGHDAVAQAEAVVPGEALDLLEHELGLLVLGVGLGHGDGPALLVVGEQVLIEPLVVGGDHGAGRGEDGCR